MSSLQITSSFRHYSDVPIRPANCHSSTSVVTALNASTLSYVRQKIPKNALKLRPGMYPVHLRTPVFLLGGEGKSKNDDKIQMASPWKALENIIGNSKNEQSVEDLLRKQIQKQEYFDDGGNGGKGPDEGGGGGSGGDGFGDSDDENISGMLEELGQVILAVAGLIFMYMYILQGEEINTFAKDIIRFIFTRKKSLRLTRLIDEWTDYFREKSTVEEENPYWLQHEIINTPTWWDSPEKYNRIYKRCGSTALSGLSGSGSRYESETRYRSRYESEARYGSGYDDESETRYGYDSDSD